MQVDDNNNINNGVSNSDFNAAQTTIKLHQDQIDDLQKQINEKNGMILQRDATILQLKATNQALENKLKTAEALNITFKAPTTNDEENYQEADLKTIEI